ncbi:hypothetical protein K7X08_021342 [Anisodus acutangulus]|uniref:Uncharacterized protein n=1 Tax=Anisodus acutangulus TaxID=402998 RepID=A0A9Q1RBD0_9SOLA|nr:hypothetical protein K7X08_021342 [Anisodus acutangulus]
MDWCFWFEEDGEREMEVCVVKRRSSGVAVWCDLPKKEEKIIRLIILYVGEVDPQFPSATNLLLPISFSGEIHSYRIWVYT